MIPYNRNFETLLSRWFLSSTSSSSLQFTVSIIIVNAAFTNCWRWRLEGHGCLGGSLYFFFLSAMILCLSWSQMWLLSAVGSDGLMDKVLTWPGGGCNQTGNFDSPSLARWPTRAFFETPQTSLRTVNGECPNGFLFMSHGGNGGGRQCAAFVIISSGQNFVITFICSYFVWQICLPLNEHQQQYSWQHYNSCTQNDVTATVWCTVLCIAGVLQEMLECRKQLFAQKITLLFCLFFFNLFHNRGSPCPIPND